VQPSRKTAAQSKKPTFFDTIDPTRTFRPAFAG
jgi:hypothetical protein